MCLVVNVNSKIKQDVLVLVRVMTAELEVLIVGKIEANERLSRATVATVRGSQRHIESLVGRG